MCVWGGGLCVWGGVSPYGKLISLHCGANGDGVSPLWSSFGSRVDVLCVRA